MDHLFTSDRIGTSKRVKLNGTIFQNDEVTPGPGSYTVKPSSYNPPATALRGKPRQKNKNCNPGPGQYNVSNVSISVKKQRCATLGLIPKASSMLNKTEITPGPGAYDAKKGKEGKGYM